MVRVNRASFCSMGVVVLLLEVTIMSMINCKIEGYQRELTYQHTDGSFSAFGDSDDSGSMW